MNPVNLAEPWYSKGSSHKTTGREGSTTRGMNLMNLICGWVGGVLERGTRQVLPPTPLHLKKVQKVHSFIFRPRKRRFWKHFQQRSKGSLVHLPRPPLAESLPFRRGYRVSK